MSDKEGDRRRKSFVRRPRSRAGAPRSPETPSRRDQASIPSQRGSTTRAEPGLPRERIVVPRQERDRSASPLDVELREVRWGETTRGAYLRVVPSKQRFKRVGSGHLTATRAASTPPGAFERILQTIKGMVLGHAFSSAQIVHERLTKIKALAIFSSDALSSSAYATEEILLVLVLAGTGALHDSLPIAAVIALLIGIVTVSYRQTIRAYPSGGGAYIVAYENIGRAAGLVAGSALLVDYVLTITVSTAAGVAAVTSAIPSLHDARVLIGIAVIAIMTVGNLRGIREAGTIFAIPTYFFLLSMSTVIIIGFIKVIAGDAPGTITNEPTISEHVDVKQGITLFLILRAFSSGCAALTGIEAISNGVPAFKQPEISNARITMTWMAFILAFLFLGITFLANRFALIPTESIGAEPETIVSQLGRTVLGENVLYYGFQVSTALVLFLAANTSFSAFPPLGANLARDHFLPRQFSFRGDRLAYSNGIVILAVSAMALLAAFQADVNKLIPLYALGVFISFTLSQTGMVIHHFRLREPNWRRGIVINGLGAVLTAIVLLIIGITKFTHGAWAVIVLIPVLVLVFEEIHRHYVEVARQLSLDTACIPNLPRRETAIVLVSGIHKGVIPALQYAKALAGENVTAVYVDLDPEATAKMRTRWEQWCCGIPLVVLDSPYRSLVEPIAKYVQQVEARHHDDALTIIIPEFVPARRWQYLLHNQTAVLIKLVLRFQLGKIITTVPYKLDR